MKGNFLKIFLLLVYCVPFVFLAMNEDAVFGTCWFYLVMIVVFGVLAYLCVKTKNVLMLYVGNGLSFVSSCFFAWNFQTPKWEYYFKPFLPNQLIIFETVVAIVLQSIIVICIVGKKQGVENKMRKFSMIIFIVCLTIFGGCSMRDEKNMFFPEAKNDKIYTTVGDEKSFIGEGFTILIPDENYRYEREYDDGILDEKWEYTKKDDVEIKVTTFKNYDEISARGRFIKENNEYIFEDMTGYSVCGTEPDGDVLWFDIYESNGTVYVVSWEYPKNTSEKLKNELATVAGSFKITD